VPMRVFRRREARARDLPRARVRPDVLRTEVLVILPAVLALGASSWFTVVRPCSPKTSVASEPKVLLAIRSYSRCAGTSPAPLSGRKEKRSHGVIPHRIVPPKPLAE
jgi:hypothetical protein